MRYGTDAIRQRRCVESSSEEITTVLVSAELVVIGLRTNFGRDAVQYEGSSQLSYRNLFEERGVAW